MMDVAEEKSRLRSFYRKKRDELDTALRNQLDERIYLKLVGLKEYKDADTVLAYSSIGSEVSTQRIIDRVLDDNKLLALPRCAEGFKLEFYYVSSMSQLERGSFGILQPKSGLRRVEKPVGMCIVPGLCFDYSGIRLGYGKGYYDRFLPELDGIAVGLCRSGFLLETLPSYDTDRKVDMIIADDGILNI